MSIPSWAHIRMSWSSLWSSPYFHSTISAKISNVLVMNFYFWGDLGKSDMHELSHVGSNVLCPSTAAMILLTKAWFSRYRMILPEWRKNGTSNNAFCQGVHSLHHKILYFFVWWPSYSKCSFHTKLWVYSLFSMTLL